MNDNSKEMIEKYIDGTLSLEEMRAFADELKNNQKLRHDLSLAVTLHGLAQGTTDHKIEEKVMNEIEDLKKNDLDHSILTSIRTEKEKREKQNYWKAITLVGVAAQIFVSLFVFYLFTTFEKVDTQLGLSIGTVNSYEGRCFIVRNEEKLALSNNMTLKHRDQVFVEEKGYIDFQYLDGSKIKFLNYSYAQLNNLAEGKHILLFSGSLNGEIKKQPHEKPLRVITEHSESLVLGTSIEMNSSDDSTFLEVKDGQVQMQLRNSGKPVLIGASEYAISKNNQLSLHKVMEPLFVSELITKDTPSHSVEIDVDLHGSDKIYLVVTDGGNGISFDHAGWHKPKVHAINGNIMLSDRKWVSQKSGWGGSKRNYGYRGREVRVNEKVINDVIVTHSNSVIVYNLPIGSKRFTVRGVLLESGVKQNKANTNPSVKFEVYTELPHEKLTTLTRTSQSY